MLTSTRFLWAETRVKMATQAAAPLGRSASVHRARASVAITAASGSGSGPSVALSEQPLANYLLGKEIGRGAFGVVFEALDRRTGSRVAVKRLPLYSVSPEDLPAILSEIDLLKRLEHPNIVKLIDSARTRDYLYICLELVEAGSLLQAIQRFGPFEERLAAVYVAQVLRGLSFLAVQGVVHRDLKVCAHPRCRPSHAQAAIVVTRFQALKHVTWMLLGHFFVAGRKPINNKGWDRQIIRLRCQRRNNDTQFWDYGRNFRRRRRRRKLFLRRRRRCGFSILAIARGDRVARSHG